MPLPIFDYPGALDLADLLERAAKDTQDAHDERAPEREAALHSDNFAGPYGQVHRGYRGDENTAIRKVADVRTAATAWARQWANAVNDRNDFLYQEELKAMDRANDDRRAAYDERLRWGVVTTLEQGTVGPPTKTATPPVATTGFTPDDTYFAHYQDDGINRSIDWRGTP